MLMGHIFRPGEPKEPPFRFVLMMIHLVTVARSYEYAIYLVNRRQDVIGYLK